MNIWAAEKVCYGILRLPLLFETTLLKNMRFWEGLFGVFLVCNFVWVFLFVVVRELKLCTKEQKQSKCVCVCVCVLGIKKKKKENLRVSGIFLSEQIFSKN